MRPKHLVPFLLVFTALSATLGADVRTRQKVQIKFEGMLGRIMSMGGGAASGDGETTTVAVKGARKAQLGDRTGQIVDLDEERIYTLDMRRKEYRVVTFQQMREQLQKARADAEQAAKDMPPGERDELAGDGKEVEIEVDVKETGQTKTLAGHPARQVIVTVTAHEKGKTLEEGGGVVMTNDTWVGPKIDALNELLEFDLRFFKAVYGDEAMAAAQQFGAMLAAYPSVQKLMDEMGSRLRAIDGTVLMATMKTETIKSAAAMAQTPAAPTGGLGGALARRLGAGRKPEQRSVLFTSTTETLSIDTTASDGDVALPAGFKERR